tara:strand:- start:296 stop:1354 length:1059 start_codon:yes stop_codon:yes gene_type:complete
MLQSLELGGLAATTASADDPKLQALLTDAAPTPAEVQSAGWLRLQATPATEHATLLALDVEMIERRKDRLRVPISAAVVQCELRPGDDAPATAVLVSGFVDPSAIDPSWASGDADAWDYKEAITGHTHAQLLEARDAGRMMPLRELQRTIAAAVHGATFVVGHNIPADLHCLQLHGACLRRRVVDTQHLYRQENGKMPALKTLVAAMLAEEEAGSSKWHAFQGASHDPLLDAEAPLQLVLRELRLLTAEPGRPVGKWGGGPADSAAAAAAAAVSAISRSYRVPEGDVGKIIGKAGATIKTLRQRSGASVQLAERGPGKFPAPRLIELRGTAEAVALAKQMLESMCSSVTPAR